ncbi:MAG: AAA family ATPase, partial [Burkholderiales bacterium]|nr:AAA family ATPase [Burkholderiales bacterium]
RGTAVKIHRIEINNFLRLRRLKVDLREPAVHLFCGHNEAGKTSLQEALRYCLLGETERINLKRDYKLMITDGAKEGTVRIVLDIGSYARDVATAKGSAESLEAPVALEYLLDATRYAWMDAKK